VSSEDTSNRGVGELYRRHTVASCVHSGDDSWEVGALNARPEQGLRRDGEKGFHGGRIRESRIREPGSI
jgi:hypothetical protein